MSGQHLMAPGKDPPHAKLYTSARADPGFFRKGARGVDLLERGGSKQPRSFCRNLYCKWCIFNQFRLSTKS